MSGNANLKNFKLIALDTNIFIYHYHRYVEFIPLTDSIFNSLAENKIRAVTSLIALTELLSFKASVKKIKELEEGFATTPNLTVLPIDYDLAIQAANIRREYNFRLPDAIQLASALYVNADAFITNDKKLQRFKGVKVSLLSSL